MLLSRLLATEDRRQPAERRFVDGALTIEESWFVETSPLIHVCNVPLLAHWTALAEGYADAYYRECELEDDSPVAQLSKDLLQS